MHTHHICLYAPTGHRWIRATVPPFRRICFCLQCRFQFILLLFYFTFYLLGFLRPVSFSLCLCAYCIFICPESLFIRFPLRVNRRSASSLRGRTEHLKFISVANVKWPNMFLQFSLKLFAKVYKYNCVLSYCCCYLYCSITVKKNIFMVHTNI